MTRFYLRIVVTILIVLLASIKVFERVGKEIEDHFTKPNTIKQLNELAVSLGAKLRGLTLEQAKAKLAEEQKKRTFTYDLLLPEEAIALQSSEKNRAFLQLEDLPYWMVIEPDPGLLELFSKEEGRYVFRGLVQVFFIIGLAGFFIVRPLVKKLRLQESAILKIADGDLSARVHVDSKDAIGRLGNRINQMAERIQELLGQQRQLLQAVSHEMRTPTARIGFALEMLGDATTDEERRRRIASLHDDLGDMESLLDELLTFLRFEDDTQKPLPLEACDLIPMIRESLERVAPFRPEVARRYEGPDRCLVRLSRRYFPRVLENLLLNAVRYAESGVIVNASATKTFVTITVSDDGPGVPEEDRERLFEPFIRLDPSRDRQTGGSGLGLAIAKRVVDRHGGTIAITTSAEGGAAFVITLGSAVI